MSQRQIIAELAALRHPVPTELDTGVDMPPPPEIARRRAEYAATLTASTQATGEHPLLVALRDAAERRTASDWHVKRLLGYARAVSDEDPDGLRWDRVLGAAHRLGVPDPDHVDPRAQAEATDAIAGQPRRRWPVGMRSLEVQRLHTALLECGVGAPPAELLGTDPDGEYRWWIAQSRRLTSTDSQLASTVARAAHDWFAALLRFAYPRAEEYATASALLGVMSRDLVDVSGAGLEVDRERELLDEVIATLTQVRAGLGEVATE